MCSRDGLFSAESGKWTRFVLCMNVSSFRITSWSFLASRPLRCFSSSSLLRMLATIYASRLLQLHLIPFTLPISLNSLDREGVRLLSPRDSQFTSKTSLQVPMIPCRWRNRAQGGARWRSCSCCCFVSSWSVVEPSRGDRGSFALGVVFLYLVP